MRSSEPGFSISGEGLKIMKTEDRHGVTPSSRAARQRRLGQAAIKRLMALHWVQADGATKQDELDPGARTAVPRTRARGPVSVEPARAAQGLPARP